MRPHRNQTTNSFDLHTVQAALARAGIDAWLFCYFNGNDPLALRILGLDAHAHYSRRWFYLVPARGEPVKLVHRIEAGVLDSLPGRSEVYLGWLALEQALASITAGLESVAMQYSPRNAIPYVSRVDAGTIELIRSFGLRVVSSADLVSRFEATLSDSQLQSHRYAADCLRRIVFESFAQVREAILCERAIDEHWLSEFVLAAYERYGLVSSSRPIVAFGPNSGNPHYQPEPACARPTGHGELVLLDIWAKQKSPPESVYADITWTGFTGSSIPPEIERVFACVAGARDAGLALVRQNVEAGRPLEGRAVDDACRAYIAGKGFGDFFLHRTGHSIGVDVHGSGTNMDNLETSDMRLILPRTCFSIEPGISLDDFGIRSEIDVCVGDSSVEVSGQPVQSEVIAILGDRFGQLV